jgi:hypothetical protein
MHEGKKDMVEVKNEMSRYGERIWFLERRTAINIIFGSNTDAWAKG